MTPTNLPTALGTTYCAMAVALRHGFRMEVMNISLNCESQNCPYLAEENVTCFAVTRNGHVSRLTRRHRGYEARCGFAFPR
jgi:hypothetical protein